MSQPHQERTRPHQGDLVQAQAFAAPVPIVDIGVNLMDHSFQSVRPAGPVGLHRRNQGGPHGRTVCGQAILSDTVAVVDVIN